MSLAVKPNFPRGEVILDPLFYSSAPFVEPLRRDIDELLQTFKSQYEATHAPRRVFSLFKNLWISSGWRLLHLSVLEDLDRDAFTLTVFRLFLGKFLVFSYAFQQYVPERIADPEPPIIRAGALFGLYTVYFTQPERVLRVQAQIPIPIGKIWLYLSHAMIFIFLFKILTHHSQNFLE